MWRPLLARGGRAAVSECSWLTQSPPDEPASFWAAGYPTMGTVEENVARAERAGYSVLGTLVLPGEAWWDEYYAPMRGKIAGLRERAISEAALAAAIAATEREIAMYERYGDSYGYVFYLLAA